MKSILVCLLAASTLGHAQNASSVLVTSVTKDVSEEVVKFDVSFVPAQGTGGGATIGTYTLYSEGAELSAQPSCNYLPTYGRYMNLDLHNRLGVHLAAAYKSFPDYQSCENLRLKLFENPKRYAFRFGALNYWNNREFTIEDTAAKN